MNAAERQAIEELRAAEAALKPLQEKLGSGQRLSIEERAAGDQLLDTIGALESEVRQQERLRKLAEANAPAAPGSADEGREDREWSEWLRRGKISPELRAAGEATGSAGGFLVPPGWWQRLQVAQKAFGGLAPDFEQIVTESGQSMQWATVDPTTTVATLLTENTQVSPVDYTFGQGTLGAYMFTNGAQLVSFQLANDSAFDLDGFVRARVAEAHGRAMAQYAVSGTGSNQPLGIVTALAAKSSTGVAGGTITQTGGFLTLATAGPVKNFGGTTTELIANTINPNTALSMIASVDPAYRAMGAAFYLTDQQALGLRGQVDANGRPLLNLQDGLTEGAIGTLFGYPVKIAQQIPGLVASTTGGPIFGHLPSAMVQRTVSQAGLMRLNERYADFLQVGYIGYQRWDMRSNDLRAAVTVRTAGT